MIVVNDKVNGGYIITTAKGQIWTDKYGRVGQLFEMLTGNESQFDGECEEFTEVNEDFMN